VVISAGIVQVHAVAKMYNNVLLMFNSVHIFFHHTFLIPVCSGEQNEKL